MLRVLLIATALVASVIPSEAKESQIPSPALQVRDDITSSLVMNQEWVPYPSYSDRDGWAAQLGEYQGRIAAAGEKYLGFQWVDISDDDYRAWDLRDDRHQMEDKYFANQEAIRNLFVAELAEGKGRYMPDIAAGVAWWCDLYSWSVVTHLAKLQTNKNPVPNPGEQIVELQSGNVSQMMAWLHYFLGAELDKIQPGLADRLKNAVKEKTMDTYMQRDDFWWLGFDTSSGKKLNNWNPWCNQNVLLCFMLLEDDRDRLAQAVERTMRSVDLWVDSLPRDGCCDEGTTYWYKSTGHLLDYLENLDRITGGTLHIWDEPLFQKMGEFIVNADIGDCWQVNFADGTPSRRPISYWIYRYGKASGNRLVTDFAVNSFHRYGADPLDVNWTLFYQGMEAITACREMKALPSPEVKPAPFVYYPQTDVCFARAGKGFLAAKGGTNGERHNHNDVGSCIYFYDSAPVLIDAGIGNYEKNTFGPHRYENWFVQSGWHNLPIVNGCEQVFGEDYRVSGSRASRLLRRYVTDIAGAYPDSAGVESWKVSYRLRRDGSLVIRENFSLKETLCPNVLHFLVNDEPVLSGEGEIQLRGVTMRYDASAFEASVEEKPMVGLGFSDRWGKSIYRIVLTAKNMDKEGRYVFRFVPSPEEPMELLTARVLSVAKKQFAMLHERLGTDKLPRTLNEDRSVKDCGISSWTSGFFPGSLWLLYQLTDDDAVRGMAEEETVKLAPILCCPTNHDIGFQINCSYGNAYRQTGDEKYLPLVEDAARTLARRFNPTVGATLSWEPGTRGKYPVIIDNMMNLELLEYASKLFECDSLQEIAVTHAETTMRNHFRPDYSSWHMLDYDPSTGEILRRVTVQGYSDDSAWARGQAWGLYGFTMMFRETGREEFLAQAENIARMLLDRLPANGIPWWDFDDPEIPSYRDASAGAILASAFIELSTLLRDKRSAVSDRRSAEALAKRCLAMAERQIRTLAGPDYLAPVGENGNFLLRHSVGNLPGGVEIDVPLTYADYYFLEALCRYNAL